MDLYSATIRPVRGGKVIVRVTDDNPHVVMLQVEPNNGGTILVLGRDETSDLVHYLSRVGIVE